MESCVETRRRETTKEQVIVDHNRDVLEPAIRVRESVLIMHKRLFVKLVG